MPVISNLSAPQRGECIPDAAKNQPKLLDDVRKVLRLHHYSIHTERSYVDWTVSASTFPLGHRTVRLFPSHAVATGPPPRRTEDRSVPADLAVSRDPESGDEHPGVPLQTGP